MTIIIASSCSITTTTSSSVMIIIAEEVIQNIVKTQTCDVLKVLITRLISAQTLCSNGILFTLTKTLIGLWQSENAVYMIMTVVGLISDSWCACKHDNSFKYLQN